MDQGETIIEKVVMDPIHGFMRLHPLLVKIIDTPQFQRLRGIKQMGACYYVFPGASHNRFEHAVGVSHIAGLLVRELMINQPELQITMEDRLCIEIAGLCHDLGHGPFSHMFESKFMAVVKPKKNWHHEQCSLLMFDHLIKENNLEPQFKLYKLDQRDLIFIKELIIGYLEEEEWKCKGRDLNKYFMYQIIANKNSGVDVDKWEYIARDTRQIGMGSSFDYMRFIKFVRVLPVSGRLQLCFRDKEVTNLYDMFYTRHLIHVEACQHKNVIVVECMISEAFKLADEHMKFSGKGGKLFAISECVEDMTAFCKLDDSLVKMILDTDHKNLEPARVIIKRILQRNLYASIGATKPLLGRKLELVKDDKEKIADHIWEMKINIPVPKHISDLSWRDVILVQIVNMDYGMRDRNPIDNVKFYSKYNPTEAFSVAREQVSQMLPDIYFEQYVCVYCKITDPKEVVEIAKAKFRTWCADPKHGMLLPQGMGVMGLNIVTLQRSSYGTPCTEANICCKEFKTTAANTESVFLD